MIQRVKKLASKIHVHFVNFAAKFVHTRRALSSIVINSHQELVSNQACNPLDPHKFFLSFSRWRSFTVPGTNVAPFPYLMWGVVFTACVVFSFSFFFHLYMLVHYCKSNVEFELSFQFVCMNIGIFFLRVIHRSRRDSKLPTT